MQQQKVTRQLRFRNGYGPIRRPKAKKKMTVELREPFVWPEPPKDQSAYVLFPILSLIFFRKYILIISFGFFSWEKDQFFSHHRYSRDLQDSRAPAASAKAVPGAKEAFEKQAKDLLEGRKTFKPTWQSLGLRYDRPALTKFAVKEPKDSNGKKQTDTDKASIESGEKDKSP